MRTLHANRAKFAALSTIIASLLLVMLLSACDGFTVSFNPNTSPTPNDFPTRPVTDATIPTVPTMVEPATVAPTTTAPTPGQIQMPQPTPVTSFKAGDEFWLQNDTTSIGPANLSLAFNSVIQDYRCGHLTTDPAPAGMVMECAVDDAAVVQIVVNQQTFNLALYSPNRGGSDKTPVGINTVQVDNYVIQLRDLLYEPCQAAHLKDCPTFAQFLVKQVDAATTVELNNQFGLALHQKVNGPNGLTIELTSIDSGAESPTMDIKLSQNGQSQTSTVTMFGTNSPKPGTISWQNYQVEVKKIYPVSLNSDPNDYLALLVLTQK